MALKEVTIGNQNFQIAYDIVNPKNETDIIFLHGWGSNKELMQKAFETHFEDCRHIYIDLPGFGKSPNDIVLNTNEYASIIKLFLAQLQSDLAFVVGHSFGGKIATLINPKNLILLSSAGIIESKPLSVKLKIKLVKVFNALGIGVLSKIFRSKDANLMSENMYKTFKNVVDEDFSTNFSMFKNQAYIFWGKNDTATSLHSGKKIASLIKNSEFFPLDGGHYFFLEHSKIISQTIKDNLCNN